METVNYPPFVLGTLKIDYRPMCRHCRETLEQHDEGKCLFESTQFDPLTYEEWRDFMRDQVGALGTAGASFIRELMAAPGRDRQAFSMGHKRKKK